ncbi:GTP:AMP phosphotransferase AK3, mitochondrial [Culicoides brevitarsis]|uniref:GTP:AMP phosphotransferase AK3, mitochondrial n=1 Tax=Culicoides brevitarsis TaxID=469753 RepID=UPI00307C9464
MFRALIIGAPAAGKGTISSRIVKTFNLVHISSGDILRKNVTAKTELGKQVQKFIDSGNLVPDEVMTKCIFNELDNCADKNWLLDGFPRTVVQAEQLHAKQKLDAVINLIVPFDIIIERVKGRWVHPGSGRVYNTDFNPPKVPGKDDVTGENLVQRADDQPEMVQQRLDLYEKLTKPVLGFYCDKHLLTNFRGNTSDEIWPQVKQFLESKIK